MNKQRKRIYPNVVGGGTAIPLGNNFYFMKGRKHEQGGIDIGPNNENGLEVEGGEVMEMNKDNVKVYSSLPILNGKSPAQLVMGGVNPTKVFNAQERFKDVNKLNDDGTRKARYGTNKHFTINGNIVNKAGYVPSTGELPKANLGTVASIDKYATRKDKDGLVSNKLMKETKGIIEQGKINKEKREEIKRKKLEELPIIDVKKPNIEINRDAISDFKPLVTNGNKEKNYSHTEEKNNIIKQETKSIPYSTVYNNPSNTKLDLSGLSDKLYGLYNLGISGARRYAAKIFKPKENQSTGLDYDVLDPVIDIENMDIINDTPLYQKIPNIITGDTVPDKLHNGMYYLPESIDLNSVKVGIRNRGDYRDVDTQGAITTHMNPFTNWVPLENVDKNKGYIGVDKDGNVKVGSYYDFDENWQITRAARNVLKHLNTNDKGNVIFGDPKNWSKNLDKVLATMINDKGEEIQGTLNITGFEGSSDANAYGKYSGGRMIIKVGDETRLISGSANDLHKAIEDIKTRHNVDNVEVYSLDNGTFSTAIRPYNGKITKKDWIKYDNRNNGGGHVLYLKRLGGMSKRQKAEGGKNVLNPRGLGIQATMSKMQADAWDKKNPGEYNPFAQQFIDNFGDPTIYNSIMSDDAPAKGISLNRGYRGNTGLGFVMPELPSINLDYYFNSKDDRNGKGGGNGGKRTPSVDPKDLEFKGMTPKINGLTVEPIKPPTEIKVNIPAQTNGKTNNNWWQNNGSDLISGVSKGIGSVASYLINKNMLNKLKYRGQPTYIPQTKLKTEYNINPQLDAVDRMISETDRVTDESTASSKVANARKNLKRLEALDARTQLYGVKENKETELINADKLNQQGITEKNINAYNEWVKNKAEFENNIREKQSENAVSLVSNLTAGVDDILANRQKRKQFKQNLAAIMAANPNVPKELLEEYGLNIFNGDKIKINNTKTNTNKKIKTYKNTGFKTEEEYGRWLKNTDFDKFIEWNSARTAKERKARIKQAKKEKDKNK